MKKLTLLAIIASLTSCSSASEPVPPPALPSAPVPYTNKVKIIKKTLGCDSFARFAMMKDYINQGDVAAANKLKAYSLATGKCAYLKAGTPVVFYHDGEFITDGDYGQYTTIRPKGDIGYMVVEKCSLNSRNPELLRFPGYVSPEKPCSPQGKYME